MLERVAQGQARFVLPGLSLDARGVALGARGAVLIGTLDGVIGWLRVFGDGDPGQLAELLPELRVHKVRSALGARGFLIDLPAHGSTVMDRAARAGRLYGGRAFTGSARHLVRYRDERAPFGYDVTSLDEPQAELALHDEGGASAYVRDGLLDLREVVTRLSLIRVPGGDRLDGEARARLLLTVPVGLGAGVIGYLWRHRVEAQVARVALAERSVFAPADAPDGAYLIEVRDLPPRILESFLGTPGLALYRPVTEHLAVEVGYRHPIELGAVAGLWPSDGHVLFSGRHDLAYVLAGPIALTPARHLVPLPALGGELREAKGQLGKVGEGDGLALGLRLVPSTAPSRRVAGALLADADLARLKQLVYVLPPALLAGHRVAVTERGVLIVADGHVDLLPLGTLLAEAAPGLLVPLGMELVPRVAPEVLADALGHARGRMTVFPPDGAPFQLASAQLGPLSRRTLASVPVPEVGTRDLSLAEPEGSPRVENQALGAFALWGFPSPGAPEEP